MLVDPHVSLRRARGDAGMLRKPGEPLAMVDPRLGLDQEPAARDRPLDHVVPCIDRGLVLWRARSPMSGAHVRVLILTERRPFLGSGRCSMCARMWWLYQR